MMNEKLERRDQELKELKKQLGKKITKLKNSKKSLGNRRK